MKRSEIRAACIVQLERVAAAQYEPNAVAACDEEVRRLLGGGSTMSRLAEQVQVLVAARNADRAVRLVESVLSGTGVNVGALVGVSFAVAALAVGGLLMYLKSATRSAIEAARAQTPAMASSPGFQRAMETQSQFTTLTNSFVQELGSGQIAAAYARMTSVYQQMVPLERFAGAARNPYFAGASVSIRRSRISSDTAVVEGTLQSPAGSVPVVIQFSAEQMHWRVTGLTLGGSSALPSLVPN